MSEKTELSEALDNECIYKQNSEFKKDLREATRIIGGILKMQMIHGLIDIEGGSELDDAMQAHCKKYPNKQN